MEKLFALIIYIFDGFKDIIDTWSDKKLSLKEKIDDTIFQIISVSFCIILMISAWSWLSKII